jgi:extracellular elastinolytic metalloproteinase
MSLHHRPRALRSAAAVVAALAVTLAMATTSGQASGAAPSAAHQTNAKAKGHDVISDYDARTPAGGKVMTLRDARVAAHPGPAVRHLRTQLGVQGLVTIDPLTRTPRVVAKVNGFLTARSSRPAASVAMGYVRSHHGVFRLSHRALAGLTLRKSYRDTAGIRHLSYVQSVHGIPVFGNGLKAHVTANGRLLQVDGSPLATLPRHVGAAKISPLRARNLAIKDTFGREHATGVQRSVGPGRSTTFHNGDRAKLVLFKTLSGLRLSWQVVTMGTGYLHVIDATTGRTLYRRNLVQSDSGKVWQNYPGAPRGGHQELVNFTAHGWLPNNSPRLAGNVAHVFSDVNDDNVAEPSEEIAPSGHKLWNYPLATFDPAACVSDFICSWDPEVADSWQTNRAQNAVQVLSFLGRWHDHLAAKPIGFTRAAGNFEAVDGDAVQANAIDGADTAGGLPDANHIDNANMSTPPDGTPPTMQMYLFHQPGTAFPDEDPFIATNGGDEADVVYHEYTHGLSNRLVVDANGVSTLGNIQAGSMGEAWSDFYAADFLVDQGLFRDGHADGDVRIGQYVGWGNDLIRTQPLDCAVGSTSAKCPGTPGAGAGGYTYGDFGKIAGAPEVHADGEIWGETLWDLRDKLGSNLTENLVTRAMSLSPSNPSYLDERNSILEADMALRHGKDQALIWRVFAARGMGYFAGSVDGDDSAPAEDFSVPPPAGTPRGSLTGTVTDTDAGTPVAGAVVGFGGHASGFGGDYAAVTDAAGSYTISGILPGTYPKVFARGAGYDPDSQPVSVSSGTNTLDWTLRRDWAASVGGGSVVSFTPPDYTDFGCGPANLIDQSQAAGWGSDSPENPEPVNPQPKEIVVHLPQAVNITQVLINPTSTCGDAGSASTGDYKLETSTDGTTWTLANQGHFGVADRQATNIPLAAGSTAGVSYLRYTMIDTQVGDLGGTCPGAFDGCDFMDSTELGVYGTP